MRGHNMKKLTENQQIILNEEMSRAMLLKKAKKSLNEKQYKHFTTELALLEEKADRDVISRIELYEGIFKNLYNAAVNATQGLSNKAANYAQKHETADQIRKRLKDVLEDAATKELFNTLEGYKEKSADELKSDLKYQGLRTQADATVRETQRLFNLLGRLDPLLKMRDGVEEIARAAETLGMDAKDLLQMYGKGVGTSQQQAAQAKMDPETAAYVKARSHSAKAARDGGGGDGGSPEAKPEEDGDGGEGTPEAAPEGDSGEGAKVITVRSVQRPIINLIQRVSAAQGVDVSVKQAQEIAITITKNLVNQMRANGVEFKGVSKDLKEILVKDIEYQLSEARLARDWMQKNMKSQSKTGSKNTGVKIGSQWIATAEELFQKIKVNGLDTVDGFQDNMEEMKKEPNNYVDFLDIAQDLKQLMPRAVVSAAHSGARRRRDEFMELKNSLDTTLNLYKQFKIISIKEDGKDPSKFGNIAKIALTRDARNKYTELKRQVGTVDSKKKGTKLGQDKERIAGEKARGEDKAAEKDMSMAKPEAGKVNISQTVAKAIQNGGLDQDVAKKITPILKDKIRKIIAKHMDKDMQYLEEKVDRYVKAVIREVK